MSHSLYYHNLALRNISRAYSELIQEISELQFNLALRFPSSRLLGLVNIIDGALSIAGNFQTELQKYENSRVTSERHDWKDLGFYVDILWAEVFCN